MTELSKTKKVISHHLFEVLALYGISKQNAIANFKVVHDRGGNIKYGLCDVGMMQTYCYCHIINNIICKLLGLSEVKGIIAAASELTSYLKNAGLCAYLNSTLKTYSITRWNSVCMMFESIVENYPKIVDILTEKQRQQGNVTRSAQRKKQPLDYISSIDISAISEIADFLKPFKNISVNLEGYKSPTLHKVWPAFLKIKELLQPDPMAYELSNHAHIIEDMKSAGLDYINSNLKDIEPKEQHKVATILHPVLKNLSKLRETEKDNAYRIVDRFVKQNSQNDITPAPAAKRHRKFHEDFLNDFCKIEGKFKLNNARD